ncbi:MAG: GGDEF domain-containing protein [Caenibius sp.]
MKSRSLRAISRYLASPGEDASARATRTSLQSYVQEMRFELAGQMIQREFLAIYSGLLGLVVIAALGWSQIDHTILGLLCTVRLATICHNMQIAADLRKALANNADAQPLVQRLGFGLGIGTLSWTSFLWALDIGTTMSIEQMTIVIAVIVSIALQVIGASPFRHAMKAILAATTLGFMPALLHFAGQGRMGIAFAFASFLAALTAYGHLFARQTRTNVALQIRNRQISKRLTDANGSLGKALSNAKWLANRDSLTRIYNRRATMAGAHVLHAHMAPEQSIVVVIVDIDHFKQINDRFGHATGDAVLISLARELDRWHRSDGMRCAGRWGGEEFVAVQIVEGPEHGRTVADTIMAAIVRINELGHLPSAVRVTASLGCAMWRADTDFEDALRDADDALYRAKIAGRNCIRLARHAA